MPQPEHDEIRALLAARDPFAAAPGEPLFTPGELGRVAAGGGAGRLLAVARDGGEPLAVRFAAARALFQGGWGGAAAGEGAAADLAGVMAAALRADPSHGRWGLPGVAVGSAGRELLSLGPAAAAALLPLLDDAAPLRVEGSEAATLQAEHGWRVADLAAYLAAHAAGEPFPADADEAGRDTAIAALRARLGAAGP